METRPLIKISDVETFLGEQGIEVRQSRVSHNIENTTFVAFVETTWNDRGKRQPSSYKLQRVSAEAKRRGFNLQFVVVNDDRPDLDETIKTLLFTNFPNDIRNSFGVLTGQRASIWIELKMDLTSSYRKKITRTVADFLRSLGIELKELAFTRDNDIPTPTALVVALRTIAPATLSELRGALEKKGFTVPNDKWLSHALDRLRKKKQVVRRGDKRYFLSLWTLTLQGTRRDEGSPDVVRVLAVAAKRKETVSEGESQARV